MITYERVFANPLLAIAFKDGVEFVNDPDFRVSVPKRKTDGSADWYVVIEDHSDLDETDEEADISRPPTTDKITLAEFAKQTEKNMKPINARKENIPGTVIPMIAEPNRSPKPKGNIIPLPEDVNGCGECVNCKIGEECYYQLEAACDIMGAQER